MDNEGVARGKPGRRGGGNPRGLGWKETGEEGENKNKCGQSSSLICNARY